MTGVATTGGGFSGVSVPRLRNSSTPTAPTSTAAATAIGTRRLFGRGEPRGALLRGRELRRRRSLRCGLARGGIRGLHGHGSGSGVLLGRGILMHRSQRRGHRGDSHRVGDDDDGGDLLGGGSRGRRGGRGRGRGGPGRRAIGGGGLGPRGPQHGAAQAVELLAQGVRGAGARLGVLRQHLQDEGIQRGRQLGHELRGPRRPRVHVLHQQVHRRRCR